MTDDRYEVPPGWTWAELGRISRIVGGGTPRRDRAEFYEAGTIPWATPTDIDQDRILPVSQTGSRITELGLSKSSAQLLPAGTVLFSSRASIGKIGIAAQPMTTNQGFANLIPSDGIEILYLAYSLKRFTEQIRSLASGTTYLEVAKRELREFLIPVAPLPEQRRIVAKIEALFEQNRTARESLDRIPPLLKEFRQSVLAAAFRGDLTRDWREHHPDVEPASALPQRIRTERRRKWEEDLRAKGKDPRKAKYEEAKPVHTTDLPQLPEGWIWTNVGSLIADARYGTSQKCTLKSKGVGVLRIPNVVSGRIDLGDLKFTELDDRELGRLLVLPDDLLVVRTNGSLDLVGKAALVPELPRPYAFASYLIRLRTVYRGPLARYLDLVFRSDLARRPIEERARSTAGQFNVNLETLRSVRVPLPPMGELERVIETIDAVLQESERVEATVVAARRRADRLEQSILIRAFRGELVPQDPTDEPASALLDRILVE